MSQPAVRRPIPRVLQLDGVTHRLTSGLCGTCCADADVVTREKDKQGQPGGQRTASMERRRPGRIPDLKDVGFYGDQKFHDVYRFPTVVLGHPAGADHGFGFRKDRHRAACEDSLTHR